MSIQFGAFELDEQNYELRKNGKRVPVPRRVFDTIAFLVSNAERVVSKQELIDGPWRGQAVSDAALARVIMHAREALDDDAARPQLIATVRGRGFRFQLIPSVLAQKAGIPGSREREASIGRTFVGRAKELETLRSAWDDAKGGSGRLVLVTGEPGIGKTALVERFSRLVEHETTSLRGKAWEAGGSPPFWIWSEAMTEFCDSRDPGQLRAMVGVHARDVTRIAPQLRDALLDLPSFVPSEDETIETRFRVFDSVATFLREASTTDPLLIVLEDLHSVDDAALSLLAFVVERLSRCRILILGTCRTPDWTRRAALSALVGSSVLQVQLTGLSEAEIAEWLRAHPPAHARFSAAEVFRSTTGHPFLVKDLLEPLSERESSSRNYRVESHSASIPEHLALSVRKRLSRMPPDTLALLERACVAGREFSISQVCGLHVAADDLPIEVIGPALHEGLVEQSRYGGGRFQFNHELVRRTLYNDLPLSRRLELHNSIAEGLIRIGTRESALEIANHLLISAPQHGLEQAITWTLLAVEHAQQKLAHELAADYCQRALDLLNASGDPGLRKGDVLLALGRSHHLTWKAEQADAIYRECAEWCVLHSLDQTLGRVLLRWFETLRERVAVHEHYLVHLRTALNRIDEPGSLRAQLLAILVIADYFTKTAEEREAMFREALEMARASQDPLAVVAVINLLVISNINASDTHQSLLLGGEMLAAARAAGRPDGAMDSLVLRARCLLELGQGEAFRTERVEYERLAREFRYPAQLWHCGNLNYVTAVLDGQLEEAEAIARQSVQTAAPSLGMLSVGLFGAQLTLLALEKAPSDAVGNLEEAGRASQELLRGAPTYQPQLLLVGLQALERDDPWTAADALDRFTTAGLEKIVRDGNYLSCLALLARLAIGVQNEPAMRQVLEALTPAAGRHAANWSHYIGPVNYYLGLLHLGLGAATAAVPCFDAAIIDSINVCSRPSRAWAEYGKALALASNPDAQARAARSDLLSSARGRAKSLNMGRLLFELDAEERRAVRG